MHPTRRSVLAVGALTLTSTLASSCHRSTPAAPAPVDPDIALRASALTVQQGLADAYASTLSRYPGLAASLRYIAADHATQVVALAPSPSPSASPATSPAVPGTSRAAVAHLVALERSAQIAHARDCLLAGRQLAELLASLSAYSATVVAVL